MTISILRPSRHDDHIFSDWFTETLLFVNLKMRPPRNKGYFYSKVIKAHCLHGLTVFDV